jgi:hypothetical protein
VRSTHSKLVTITISAKPAFSYIFGWLRLSPLLGLRRSIAPDSEEDPEVRRQAYPLDGPVQRSKSIGLPYLVAKTVAVPGPAFIIASFGGKIGVLALLCTNRYHLQWPIVTPNGLNKSCTVEKWTDPVRFKGSLRRKSWVSLSFVPLKIAFILVPMPFSLPTNT